MFSCFLQFEAASMCVAPRLAGFTPSASVQGYTCLSNHRCKRAGTMLPLSFPPPMVLYVWRLLSHCWHAHPLPTLQLQQAPWWWSSEEHATSMRNLPLWQQQVELACSLLTTAMKAHFAHQALRLTQLLLRAFLWVLLNRCVLLCVGVCCYARKIAIKAYVFGNPGHAAIVYC